MSHHGEIDTIHIGLASEYAVASDLYGRGFDVYMNMGPTGKADLIVMNKGEVYTVQVKTAKVGEKTFVFTAGGEEERKAVDVYAVFLPEKKKVYYFEAVEVSNTGNRLELPTTFHPWSVRKEMEIIYETFPEREHK